VTSPGAARSAGFFRCSCRSNASADQRAAEEWKSARTTREALPEDKRRRAAEEVERRRLDELRQARLRDLGRIRRAITLELGKLQSPASLTLRWGHTSGDNEERSYWLEEGELRMQFHHRQQGGAWVWPEGGVPYQQGGRERDPAEPEDVEWAYALFQTERYLVREHLSSDDQLELKEPGYYRYGVGVPGG
jgi:hypothetical protein